MNVCGQEIVMMPMKNGDVIQKQKFPQKVMVWLDGYSKDIAPLVIFDEGTVDHCCYVKNVLVALKYGNEAGLFVVWDDPVPWDIAFSNPSNGMGLKIVL